MMIPQLRLLSPTPGIIVLANTIPNMRALSSVNLLKNKIGIDPAEALVSMLNEHPTLKSLCGNKGNETELNLSGKMNGSEDAIMLGAEVAGNGALSKFDISFNDIRAEGGKALAAGLQGNQVITELNISGNILGYSFDEDADTSGIIAIADAIPDMEALTTLDISSSSIGGCTEFRSSRFIATPEGVELIPPCIYSQLILHLYRRSCCYRQCHQGYGGHIIHQSPQELYPSRASPRACADHAGQREARHPVRSEQRGNRA
jgi:hypothetical protein